MEEASGEGGQVSLEVEDWNVLVGVSLFGRGDLRISVSSPSTPSNSFQFTPLVSLSSLRTLKTSSSDRCTRLASMS